MQLSDYSIPRMCVFLARKSESKICFSKIHAMLNVFIGFNVIYERTVFRTEIPRPSVDFLNERFDNVGRTLIDPGIVQMSWTINIIFLEQYSCALHKLIEWNDDEYPQQGFGHYS